MYAWRNEEEKMESRKKNPQYGMIDIVKFFGALLIVVAHYVTENTEGRINPLIDYAVSIYIIVVPFFFCCAGFFLFTKVFAEPDNGRQIIKQYCNRILVMYLGWSAVYIVFKVATWIRFGVSTEEIGKYILNAICYSTYKTIWFLPALCIGVLLSYKFICKVGIKKAALIALFFYLIGAAGASYSFIVEKNVVLNSALGVYNYIFLSTRNGFFNGFPFIMVGACIADEALQGKKWKKLPNLVLTCAFGIAFVAEAFVLKMKFGATNVNTLLLLVPFTYFFVKMSLSFSIKSGKLLKWMRKMSTTVFLCQRLYLTAFPSLFPSSFFSSILSGNPYIGCVCVLIITVVSAEGLVLLSRKIKLISVLC
jgi:hypothetical protein